MSPAPPACHRYVFAYAVTGSPGARPVLAFDDGERTYLHFDDLRRRRPVIRSDTGAVLAWDRRGPYAVVHGRFARLFVEVGWSTAAVVRREPRAADAAARVPAQPFTVFGNTLVVHDAAPSRAARLAAGRFVARFTDGKRAVEIDGRTIEALRALARQVRRLVDGAAADPSADVSPTLLRRALKVRQLLAARGVDAQRLRVRYFRVGPAARPGS